jgi:LDH2 family malate/lactate/ureidoglycolate dehydrogenase
MNEADLTGADAHGIFRLPQYVRRIRAGGVNTKPRISVEKTAAATALVDGDNGMGHLVVSRAVETAIALASDAGIGWVGVRHSNHAGTAGLYAAMPVAHGMIGLYAAVANANHMPVWGGSELLLGTNPLGIGLPSDGGPVVLDMATSIVSYGTVKKYALAGRDMPEGWLIDTETGQSLTDPKRASHGLLLPIGGYKGSGLALMLGLLAGVLRPSRPRPPDTLPTCASASVCRGSDTSACPVIGVANAALNALAMESRCPARSLRNSTSSRTSWR